MKMPSGRLMELVAELSRDDNTTLGELSRRWGEPAGRIGDAIDAVKVLNGEPGYITVTVPAPEPEPEPEHCRGFRWIGQPWTSCDGCGRPAWEHEGMSVLRDGASPFGGDEDWEVKPWSPGRWDDAARKAVR